MKRIIDSLNEMSFTLPQGWEVTTDKYTLLNGQGFINKENYLSQSGKVISLFAIHRNPDEFFQYYDQLVENFDEKVYSVVFEKSFSIKFHEFSFPVYILKGTKEPAMYIAQVFIDCGDKLACFMFNIDKFADNNKDTIFGDETFTAVAQILRTLE